MSQRKPINVAIHERVYAFVSHAVERALENHGTLPSFIYFIEKSFAEIVDMEIPQGTESPLWRDLLRKLVKKSPTKEKADDFDSYFSSDIENYVQDFEKVLLESSLPEIQMHLIMLGILSKTGFFDGLIDKMENIYGSNKTDYERRILEKNPEDEWFGLKWLQSTAKKQKFEFKFLTQVKNSDKVETNTWDYTLHECILRSGSDYLFFNFRDGSGEPLIKQLNVALERQQHDYFLRVFGTDSFKAITSALWVGLQKESDLFPFSDLSSYLEHNSAWFDYLGERWNPDHIANKISPLLPHDDQIPDDKNHLYQFLVRAALANHDSDYSVRSVFKAYNSPIFPETPMLPENLELFDLDDSPALNLAYRLNAITFDTESIQDIKLALPGRIMHRFNLSNLTPSRNVLAMAVGNMIELEKQDPNENPIVYHTMKLFEAFARQVIPVEKQHTNRYKRHVLAELANDSSFATTNVLEYISQARATKHEAGFWQIKRNKKPILGLDKITDKEAFTLRQLFLPFLPSKRGRGSLKQRLEYLVGVVLDHTQKPNATLQWSPKVLLAFLKLIRLPIFSDVLPDPYNDNNLENLTILLLADLAFDGTAEAAHFLIQEEAWMNQSYKEVFGESAEISQVAIKESLYGE